MHRETMKRPLFELCAPTLAAALAADRGGADRIELCVNLPVGGVTPDDDILLSVLRTVSVPVHVLIRPRAGDFVFSRQEFAMMQREVRTARQAGAAGIATGILLPDGRVDVERTRALAELGRPMSVTFHRAFDETRDLSEALEAVIATGADTLLTSGGAQDALTGAPAIARLRTQARGRIEIMAGGGIRLANLGELIHRTGVTSLHGSLSRASAAGGNPADILEQDIREAIRLLHGAPAQSPSVPLSI